MPTYLETLAKGIVNLRWNNNSTFATKYCGKVGEVSWGRYNEDIEAEVSRSPPNPLSPVLGGSMPFIIQDELQDVGAGVTWIDGEILVLA